MARCTPFVRGITADGDSWLWELAAIDVLGVRVARSFTEQMTFVEPERIEFRHAPPPGTAEKAGVAGWYQLTPVTERGASGTRLETDMSITVDLPLPRAAGPGVRAAMGRVLDTMGDRFSKNLLDHLGAHRL